MKSNLLSYDITRIIGKYLLPCKILIKNQFKHNLQKLLICTCSIPFNLKYYDFMIKKNKLLNFIYWKNYEYWYIHQQ